MNIVANRHLFVDKFGVEDVHGEEGLSWRFGMNRYAREADIIKTVGKVNNKLFLLLSFLADICFETISDVVVVKS